MRWSAFALLLVACGSEEGSLLTIRAPDGPDNVARLEIVLANADPATITRIDGQRVAPNSATNVEAVRYYRQRATAGVIEGVGNANGFTVRIESNVVMVPEKTFIPFLVAYDANENVVGVGAVNGLDGQPAPFTIEEGRAVQYFVDMVALEPMDPALGMGDRESMHVRCGANDQKRWTSGIAWRPGETQLRLLLADRSEDVEATDASERDADLDCDGFVAPSQDCDDLRSAFNVGKQDVCDGVDANCDGAATIVQSCNGAAACSTGVQLCDDRTGQPIGGCSATPQCACANGTTTGCNRCALAFKGTSDPGRQAPCAPGVGKMHFPQCTANDPCTFEVLPAVMPWKGFIAATATSGFSTKVTNVTTGELYIELKLTTADVMGTAGGSSVGSMFLTVTQDGESRVVGIDVELLGDAPTTQCPAITGTSTFSMSCSP